MRKENQEGARRGDLAGARGRLDPVALELGMRELLLLLQGAALHCDDLLFDHRDGELFAAKQR